MRRVAMITATVALGLAVAACSSGGSSKSEQAALTTPAPGPDTTIAKSASTSTAAAPVATTAQLESELLTVANMPTGWKSTPVSNSSSGSFCSISNFKSTAAAHAEADFADGNFPLFYEILASYNTSIATEFGRVVRELDACTSFKDEGSTFTLGRMSFPALGDESAAFQASGSVQGFTVGFDLVLSIKKQQVALLLYGDLGTPDVNSVEQLAHLAITKMP